jgi:hypothetical protein
MRLSRFHSAWDSIAEKTLSIFDFVLALLLDFGLEETRLGI